MTYAEADIFACKRHPIFPPGILVIMGTRVERQDFLDGSPLLLIIARTEIIGDDDL
jgi:hypothetical protein